MIYEEDAEKMKELVGRSITGIEAVAYKERISFTLDDGMMVEITPSCWGGDPCLNVEFERPLDA